MTWMVGYVDINVSIPREDEDPSIHFVEALWRVMVEDSTTELNESNYHLPTFS